MSNPLATSKGFTLVEIAIVMIIIGLLVGGIFGGVRLLDNARVLRTINDLKSAETAALTFKTSYGRPPGDVRNPSLRLQNCTTPPCSNSGNGNGIVGAVGGIALAMFPNITNENFAFWHHLTAADLSPVKMQNTTDILLGTPKFSLGRAQYMRVSDYSNIMFVGCPRSMNNKAMLYVTAPITITNGGAWIDPYELKCSMLRDMDVKMDDGFPIEGKFRVSGCIISATAGCQTPYVAVSDNNNFWTLPIFGPMYNLQGF